jgi:hypothetical protein
VIALEWWYLADQQEAHVTRTRNEIDVVLDALAALSRSEWPALAEVTQADLDDLRASVLYVGFHVDRGALMYSGPDDRAGSYSQGDTPPEGEPILYMQGTSDNEFPPGCGISAVSVRQAVHEFAETSSRPSGVPWRPVRSTDAPASVPLSP